MEVKIEHCYMEKFDEKNHHLPCLLKMNRIISMLRLNSQHFFPEKQSLILDGSSRKFDWYWEYDFKGLLSLLERLKGA
jgi:hypothetical protein